MVTEIFHAELEGVLAYFELVSGSSVAPNPPCSLP